MNLENILKEGYEQGASDVHIACGQPVIIRLDGGLKKITEELVTQEFIDQFIEKYLPEKDVSQLSANGDVDFSFPLDFSRFRVNIFRQKNGLSLAFRYIPQEILPFEKIGAPPILKEFCNRRRGLILVTGSTGSGKSTTLASMIDYINSNYAHHIITIEDPIEFVHPSKQSLINQREVFKDCKDFKQALKSALREDPDVILIGELRDLETIRLALSAAETGHLVFGTLHTNSAVKTVDRIVDVFPENEKNIVRSMMAESLIGVIAQVLLPYKHKAGRIAAHEILVATAAVRNLIRENKLPQILSVMQTARAQGMQTFDKVIKDYVKNDLVDQSLAIQYVQNKDDLV